MLTWRSDAPVKRTYEPSSIAREVDLAASPDFQLGPLLIQPSTLQVQAGETGRTIEPRVMQVLVALAGSRGSVVSRDSLVDACWGGRAVSEDAINRSIAKVRRLGEEFDAFEIETIPRVGYRLTAPDDAKRPARRPIRSRRMLWVGLGILLIAMLAAGAIWYRWNGSAPQQPKVAVLPFTVLNSDPDTRNFADGIAATIGNALAQTGARLSGDDVRTADEARKSGAAVVIGGTVRREGSTVRLTIRVDSARTGSTILTNEFQAQGRDAASLGGQVSIWLIPSVRMWSSFLPIESDGAVTDEILRIFLTRSGGDNLRAWQLAGALVQAKPRSGSAQFLLALLTSDVLPEIGADQRRGAVLAARRAATRAEALLPDPGRARAVLDCHLTAPGWHVLTPQCDRVVRAAISSDPNVPVLPFLFGWQLADSGRFQEAASFADMDLAQSPLGVGQLGLRIFATRMSHSGDSDEDLPDLEARAHRYIGPASTAYLDYRVAVSNGDFEAAEALLNNPDFGAEIAAGQTKATIQLVLRAVRSKAPGDVKAMQGACNPPPREWTPADPAFGTCLVGLTLVGDLDGTFALADRGYRDVECCSAAQQEEQWLASGGLYYPRYELFGKVMAPARADRRFIEIARRTGLLAYWKSGHPPDFCSFERAPVCDALK